MKKLLNIITIAFATAALASCCNMQKGRGCDISGREKPCCCKEKCKCEKCGKEKCCCKGKDAGKEGKIKCGKGK
ncbi:MAG TPA: hypothetical protein DIV86_07210 [Alphaproteobacteria bacterium]|nr:hypothetical protein [Alphaproteobacteria bacterium]